MGSKTGCANLYTYFCNPSIYVGFGNTANLIGGKTRTQLGRGMRVTGHTGLGPTTGLIGHMDSPCGLWSHSIILSLILTAFPPSLGPLSSYLSSLCISFPGSDLIHLNC